MKSPVSKYEWLRAMREGGAVQRYHTHRMHHPQDVAAHSWGVAVVLLGAGFASPALLAYTLLHDVAEQATGDVPAPVKWAHPGLDAALEIVEDDFNNAHGITDLYQSLSLLERKAAKWADMYELTQHALDEVMMGNLHARQMLNNGLGVVRQRAKEVQLIADHDQRDNVGRMTNALMNDSQPYL